MKFAGKILLSAGILCFLLVNSGCKKHQTEPEPVTDQQLDLLTKSAWKAVTVTLDGTPQTGYDAFTLTMTGSKGATSFTYTTAGRPALSAWPPSGNFIFDGTHPESTLTRNDATPVVVTYTATASNLLMTFTFNGAGYSNRVGNVKGAWSFAFTH